MNQELIILLGLHTKILSFLYKTAFQGSNSLSDCVSFVLGHKKEQGSPQVRIAVTSPRRAEHPAVMQNLV